MTDHFPASYGDIQPPMSCSSCGHAMFDAESDHDAGINFCPKCGRQTVDPADDALLSNPTFRAAGSGRGSAFQSSA